MMINNSPPGTAQNTPPPAILKQVTDSAANPLNERKRCLYIFMHINTLLKPNLTGELIKFWFFKNHRDIQSESCPNLVSLCK